ncbi:unnamed protein product [Gordionus sp. m RMFG-2023]|uniref:mannose-P-dolichol utilization defect 1 protein-like n=1 Tax=Gordionus sp. m RMFG-2023 TaxID=3053472 RepID=UPI0030E2BA71
MDLIASIIKKEIGSKCFHAFFGDHFDDNETYSIISMVQSLISFPIQIISSIFFTQPTSSQLNMECTKIVISKVLSYTIIMGSLLVKLPQIIKIFQARNCDGISIYSILVELLAITTTMIYGYAQDFPFSSWGDSLFMGIQTFIIANLYFYYNQRILKGSNSNNLATCLIFSSFYILIIGIFMAPQQVIPLYYISALQTFNLPIVFFSKALQIFENYKNSSTGQLSILSYSLITLGSMARIFTSIQETGDTLVILPFCLASCLNVVLILQILYYSSSSKAKNLIRSNKDNDRNKKLKNK